MTIRNSLHFSDVDLIICRCIETTLWQATAGIDFCLLSFDTISSLNVTLLRDTYKVHQLIRFCGPRTQHRPALFNYIYIYIYIYIYTLIYVEIKCQLDATDEFLLQILLLAQHVSGTIMPIIRSSRVLYKWLMPVVFGAWFSSCRYGVELRVVCPG